ncbi:transglutaminase domain-containing protein, partial [Bacteroides thetaiotaomicron]
IYKEHQLIPIGYPIVNGYNHQLYLVPDLLHTMTVEIEEQDRYLRFRPDKKYELFYWDNAWISLGTQVATMDADCLQFNQVPQNVLMLLVPEYSERKERPFIIMPDGTRYWW